MVAFIVVAVVFVAALGVLADILITRLDDPVAAPSNSPVATPTATHPPATPTAQPAGTFTSFVAPTTGECQGRGRRQFGSDVTVSWATTDATQVWVAPGSDDAVASGEQVPLSGNQDSFLTPLRLDCQNPTSEFTMTLIGDDGAHVSRTWVVTIDRHHHGDDLLGGFGLEF
jgi:hypothetical protein